MSDDVKCKCGHEAGQHHDGAAQRCGPCYMAQENDDDPCCWLGATHVLRAALSERDAQLAEAQREIARCVERSATAVHDAIDEHESSICPEDFGCRELVASLQRQLTEARTLADERLAQIRKLQDSANLRLEEFREQAQRLAENNELMQRSIDEITTLQKQLREADAVIDGVSEIVDEFRECHDGPGIMYAEEVIRTWRERTRDAAWRVK